MSERRAELLLALTTIFWSGTFVFTKLALVDCDPLYFVTLPVLRIGTPKRNFEGVEKLFLLR